MAKLRDRQTGNLHAVWDTKGFATEWVANCHWRGKVHRLWATQFKQKTKEIEYADTDITRNAWSVRRYYS